MIPILILVAIVIPSFKLLYFEGDIQKPDMIIKAIGHQWYWSYEYTDRRQLHLRRQSGAGKRPEAGPASPADHRQSAWWCRSTRLIEVQDTSTDVIHSWAMPSFGVKTDAVPGKLNDTWFKVTQPGIYYGQCSELCGNGHGYMPITVQAVSKADFKKWVDEAKKKFAKADGSDAAQVAAVPAN